MRPVLPDVRRPARLLSASLLVSWIGAQVSAALGGVVVLRLTGRLDWVGLPFFVVALASAAAAYPAGHLMDRVGRVPVLVGGHVLAAVGFLGCTIGIVLGSIQWFFVGLIVGAVGAGATYLTRLAAADLYPAAKRGRGLALVVWSASVGAVLGTPLIALTERLAPSDGLPYYAYAFGTIPVLSLVAAVFVAFIRPDPRAIAVEIQANEPTSAARAGVAKLQLRPFIVAGLVLALAQGAMICVMSIAGPSLDHAEHSATLIGLTLSAHVVGMFFFSPWIGMLADRWGRRPVLFASGALLLLGTAMVAMVPLGILFSVALFLIGVGWSFAFIGATAVIADVVPALRRGRATGVVDVASASSGAMGALAGGWALSAGGLAGVGSIAAALAIALTLAAAFLAVPRLRARAPA